MTINAGKKNGISERGTFSGKKTLTKNSKDVESGISDTRNLGKKFLMLSAVSRCFKSKKKIGKGLRCYSVYSITEGALGV